MAKGSLGKWMAQKGARENKIHDEESEYMGDHADVPGGGSYGPEHGLKRELSGKKPFDLLESDASFGNNGEDSQLSRGQRHTGNASGKPAKSSMSAEHSNLLGLGDGDDMDDDDCGY